MCKEGVGKSKRRVGGVGLLVQLGILCRSLSSTTVIEDQ